MTRAKPNRLTVQPETVETTPLSTSRCLKRARLRDDRESTMTTHTQRRHRKTQRDMMHDSNDVDHDAATM